MAVILLATLGLGAAFATACGGGRRAVRGDDEPGLD